MQCIAYEVGASSSRVYHCIAKGGSSSGLPPPQGKLPTPSPAKSASVPCALQPLCCKRHPREQSCISHAVDERNAETTRIYPKYALGSPSVRKSQADAAITVESGLPGAVRKRVLTLVQSHRQTTEYALQAAMFSLHRTAGLVADSDLLLHCNNVAIDRTTLLRYLARYPHDTRALIHSADNADGYRCGHLKAIEKTAHVWRVYPTVLFLHPDVYLLPRAINWLGDSLAVAQRRQPPSAFLVTKMFWDTGSRGGQYFGTDLFTFKPSLLGKDFWNGVCQVPPDEPIKLPERTLYRLTRRLPISVLGNRTTSGYAPDAFGVWHSHAPVDVAKWLSSQRH